MFVMFAASIEVGALGGEILVFQIILRQFYEFLKKLNKLHMHSLTL